MAVPDISIGDIVLRNNKAEILSTVSQNEVINYSFSIWMNNVGTSISHVDLYLMNGTTYCVSEPIVVPFVSRQHNVSYQETGEVKTLKNGDRALIKTNIFTHMNSGSTPIRALAVNNIRAIVHYNLYDPTNTKTIDFPIDTNAPTAINVRMQPIISNCSFKRCNSNNVLSDSGMYIQTSLKTSFASSAYKDKFGMTIALYQANGTHVKTASINAGDSRLTSLYNGITNSNMFINTFTLNSNMSYYFIVTIGDNYESSRVKYNVQSEFVNVHLSSAKNGGVSLGIYSSSTDSKPLFESNYDTQLKKTLTVGGASTLQSSLAVSGATSIKGQLDVKNSTNGSVVTIRQNGDISAVGKISSSDLKATNKVEAKEIYVAEKLDCYGGIYCVDGAIIEGHCNIGGNNNSTSNLYSYNYTHFYKGISTLNMNWQTLTVASHVTTPGSYGGPALRIGKVGTHVYLSGSINASASTSTAITTIPSAYRPKNYYYYSLRPCQGARVARMFVNTNGEIYLEWVRNLSNGAEYSGDVWVDCNFDYWIE